MPGIVILHHIGETPTVSRLLSAAESLHTAKLTRDAIEGHPGIAYQVREIPIGLWERIEELVSGYIEKPKAKMEE